VAENLFGKQGEYWTIAFDGNVTHVRDTKGLRYIAALLDRPGVRVHARELRAADTATVSLEDPRLEAERARLVVTQRIKASLRKIAELNPPLGEHLGGAIHTGVFCRYEPQGHVSWRLF
jgi:hypothetical protein